LLDRSSPPATAFMPCSAAPHWSARLTVHVAPAEQWPAIVRRSHPKRRFSALGTTWRKGGFRGRLPRVDHDHVLAFARAAREAGAARMVSISLGRCRRGSANFYLRIKGEVEAALADLGFDRLDLLRRPAPRPARR
jgi:hypothetical protein